jgi:aryl-alcohol dehydrogenase-like predicted oxidoreductase
MELTVVGMGTWAIGGPGWSFGWGVQDDRDSVAAIRHAIAAGVNWIDTAAAYGVGHAEEVVASALDVIPDADRPYVFTKCGVLVDPDDPFGRPRRAAAPDSIRRELEASLRRLGSERLDLYQVHWPPDDGTALEDYWSTMLDLRQEGKVRAIGLSNHALAKVEAASALGHVDSLQLPFSAIRREAAAELAWCSDHGTGVIAYAPMQSGLLTGAFSSERVAGLTGDWRGRDPEFTGERLVRNLAVAEALRAVAERHDATVPAVAVSWVLGWRGVTGAIVGGRRPSQVDGWLPAASLVLDDSDYEDIARTIEGVGAGGGPVRPPRPT